MPQDPADDDDVIRLEPSQSPEVFDRSLDFSASAHTVAMPSPLETSQTIASETEGSSLGAPASPAEVGRNDAVGSNGESRPVRYNVQTEVGRGGMGIVYRARDEKLGRSLAIKVLQDVSAHKPEHQQREIARFVDEAKLSAQLDHPGLVPVYELEYDATVGYYFTMRLIKGKHLGEISHLAREQKDGWNLSRAVGVMVKVCEAVAYAHSKNVIHRDLKPGNVMVGRFGAVYVMDWGLAKVLGQEDFHDLRPQSDVSTPTHTVVRSDRHGSGGSTAETPLITMDGSVIGTPAYMPPEQAKGMVEEVDDKSDIYSLGSILYHLLTGQAPYIEPKARLSPHTILGMVIQGPPERIRKLNPDAPSELVAICEKAMAREKSQRYANSLDLAEDLQAYLDGRVVRAYRTGAVAELRSWVSRNRLTAMSGIGVLLATVAGLLGVVGVQRASSREVRMAKEQTRRYLYDGNLQLVQQAWDNGAVFRARELLDRQIPKQGEQDLRSFAWRYFDHLCRTSEERPTLPHDDIVTSIAFSPDGKFVASGCNDGQVRLWNRQDWTMQRMPGDHQIGDSSDPESEELPAVDYLTFTADGSRLISVGRSGDVYLRDVDGHTQPIQLAERVYPWARDGSNDGHYLAAPDQSQRQILIWDLRRSGEAVATAQRLEAATDETDRIEAIHFSPDGQHLFSNGVSGVAKRWQVSDGTLISSYGQPMETTVPLLDVSPKGDRLAVTRGNEVTVWDVESGELIGKASGPVLGMKHLHFSKSGDYVATCGLSEAGEVMIWRIDPEGLRLIQSESRHPGMISRMEILGGDSDGFVTSGGHGNVVRIWDFSTGQLVSTFRGHDNELYGLATSADGRFVATGGRGHEVRVWDLQETPAVSVLPGHDGIVWSGAFSPNGRQACTAAGDGRIRIWETSSGKSIGELIDRRRAQGTNGAAHKGSVQYIRYMDDGSEDLLLSCAKDGDVKLWNVAQRELIGQIHSAHERGTNAFDFTKDGRRLITCGDDGLVKVWSATELYAFGDKVEPLRVIGPIGKAAWGLTCSPTANLVACSGIVPGHKIFVWDLDSENAPMELAGHTNSVTHLKFSHDGRILGSASHDGSIRLWDIASGKELPSPQSPLRGHSGDIQSMLFTRDGLSLVSASMDHTIRIWDRQTGESLCSLAGHASGVQFVTISPDESTLLTTSWDQTARLWRASPEAVPEPGR